MKKEERLFAIIGMTEDKYVLEAEQEGKIGTKDVRKFSPQNHAEEKSWNRRRKMGGYLWGAAAATLVLVVGIAGVLAGTLRMGNGSWDGSGNGSERAEDSGEGHEKETEFMSYAGPVFPLHITGLDGETEVTLQALSAARNIRYQVIDQGEGQMKVEDCYAIANGSEEDVTVLAYYPYEGNLKDYGQIRPDIRIDGKKQEAETKLGASAGGILGASCTDNQDQRISAEEIRDWRGYQELLADGTYFRQALEKPGDLAQTVTVYEFFDFQAPLEEYPAATQEISFSMDESETQIMTYGFSGIQWDDDAGIYRYNYFVPAKESASEQKKVLLVFGEDIGSYELKGYQDGGCKPGEELSGVSCHVERRKMPLALAVQELSEDFLRDGFLGESQFVYQQQLCEEAVNGTLDLLLQFQALDNGSGISDWMRLEDLMGEAVYNDRVMYEEILLTIPAHATVQVAAVMEKKPSFDYDCFGSENIGIKGYDMVTRLGSDLEYSKITAELLGAQDLEIVRQNFGFDPELGIWEVELDAAQEHYYMELRKKNDLGLQDPEGRTDFSVKRES